MTKTNHVLEPEDLMAYLDGELRPDRAAEAASHLAQCRECQKLAAEFQEISRTMTEWEVEPPSEIQLDTSATVNARESNPGLKDRLRSARAWWRTWGWRLAGVGAASVLILAIAIPNHLRSTGPREGAQFGPVGRPQMTQIPEQKAQPAVGFNGLGANDGRISTYLYSQGAAPQSADQTVGKLTAQKQQAEEPAGRGPMIVRTANLSLVSKDFEAVRARLDSVVRSHRGYIAQLTANSPTENGRSLIGVIRVPSGQLDQAVAEIKSLGRVESESQNGQEVTAEYVDLEARLTNARNTEQRLTDILRNRTGKLSDVLAVEQEIDRVRGEIEQMQAQKKALKDQVDLASINFSVHEEYKSQLNVVPPSTGTQIRNAAVQGYRSLVDGLLALLLWLLASLPSLLVWGAVLFFPARFAWRKMRRQVAH